MRLPTMAVVPVRAATGRPPGGATLASVHVQSRWQEVAWKTDIRLNKRIAVLGGALLGAVLDSALSASDGRGGETRRPRRAAPADCATTAGSGPGSASRDRLRAGLASRTACSRPRAAGCGRDFHVASSSVAASSSGHVGRPARDGQAAATPLWRLHVSRCDDAQRERRRRRARLQCGWPRIGRRRGLVQQPPPRTDTAPATQRLASWAHIESTCRRTRA
jgi:hypothetical protein